MVFVEFRFFIFLLIVFCLNWTMKSSRNRKVLLLGASYFFYAIWDWRFLGLIILSTGVDYVAGIKLSETRNAMGRRAWLLLSLGVNLGVLAFFKYCNFFIDSAVGLLNSAGLPFRFESLDIILPVGISFYTFQTLSYTIDIYRGTLQPTRKPLDFALFVAFFPQLVAGPIVRASEFLPQLQNLPRFDKTNVRRALMLFLTGFFKKACIADNVAVYVDQYFAAPQNFDCVSAWLATLLYSIQIYCDFSGYSDMAIAMAALLGYRLSLNFNFPYFAPNIADFWRRWHISLSSWLRDYLYVPLGGNRHGRIMTYRNLMLTMLLGGLWHGAAWTFVFWGFLHGAALMIERGWRFCMQLFCGGRKLPFLLGVALTYYWVNLAWIFFRAPDFAAAWVVVRSYVFFESPGTEQLPALLWVHCLALGMLHFTAYQQKMSGWFEKLPAPVFAAGYGVAFQLCLTLVPTGYRPFIYFQF